MASLSQLCHWALFSLSNLQENRRNRRFIFRAVEVISVGKFRGKEKTEVESIIASLTIKRLPDPLIIQHISKKTGKSITQRSLWSIRQRIKRDSYSWYSQLRQGEYEFIHEFRKRINEIIDLQQQHHQIILENQRNPTIVQSSLAELHKLTITLSNLYDVAPAIVNYNGNSIPAHGKDTTAEDNRDIIV